MSAAPFQQQSGSEENFPKIEATLWQTIFKYFSTNKDPGTYLPLSAQTLGALLATAYWEDHRQSLGSGGDINRVTGAGLALGEEGWGPGPGREGARRRKRPDRQPAVDSTSRARESPVTQSPGVDCVKRKNETECRALGLPPALAI